MIDRVEIQVHSHATEDVEKVKEAVRKLLGVEQIEFTELKARGHHGNPIITLIATLKGKEAERAVRNLLSKMDEFDFEIMVRELDIRSEKSKLYLRFDKQKAYLGKTEMSSGSDVIRVVIVFKGRKVSEDLLRELRGSE
ncbi:hypothetical protein EYM_01690 [Ignicoccus islandicus DSM 13165]|uniref:Exosome protein n=1 Tax=Ignicoccus islandicus DSM 13165 TaxID=940295 RepID=A0A0U2M967_9CREN|nr:RNA-binding domain-containing protein [Ignicoccus islandicus]ALU11501.1 hypothetical protein EYM_01690 [Ignicoccus islandicus DSM 13165]